MYVCCWCVEATFMPGKLFTTEDLFMFVCVGCYMSICVGKMYAPMHNSETRRGCQVPSSVIPVYL